MNLLNLYANGNLLTLSGRPMTTSGSVNYDTCAFNFNSEWKGFARTAVFAIEDVCYAVELDDTGVCKIPKECLKKTGILKIGVVGENDDGTIISTNIATQRIVEGANNNDFKLLPADPEVGEDGAVSNESAIHLLWQDDSFELEKDFLLDSYSDVDETDIQSVYNVTFSRLAEKYPTYVTANVEGQDYSGNDIMSFTFTGDDYDRVILISANHFASSYITLRALGGFFKNLCENYKRDANLNFLHSKVKFVVLPIVCPEALLSKSGLNSNGVAPFVNYDHFFDMSPIENKGDASFSEPETIPVISHLDIASGEKCVFYFDFECENTGRIGKKIYIKSNDMAQCNEIIRMVSKFDCGYSQTEFYAGTEYVETNAPIATNYAAYMYSLNACTVVWDDPFVSQESVDRATLKYIKLMGTLFIESAKSCINTKNPAPKPVTKQVVWRGNAREDYVTVPMTISPMWVSGSKLTLEGNCNVSLSGHIIVDAQEETNVRVRPVLYQGNSPTDDYDTRLTSELFDTETTVREGLNTIPFSSVIGCKYSNYLSDSVNTELGVVIAAASASPVKVIAISYTVNAVPSDARGAVEVLSPTGQASDYTDRYNTPVFEVKYPGMYYDAI